MRILLGHEYYRSSAPSGEDSVFRNERRLLESRNIEVIPFERFNDDIDSSTLRKRLKLALSCAWSKETYTALAKLMRKTRPDMAHFHNTFPLISPSAYAACQDNGVPVVQTLHNYRFVCPGSLLQRDGHACEDCLETSLLPALIHRCYRGSRMATGALVWMTARNRWSKTYSTLVNRYIALSHFASDRLIAGGLPKSRMEVKPNFLPNAPKIRKSKGGYAVFVGRLSQEKGVKTLLKAWQMLAKLPLKILGDGELREQLENQARQQGLNIDFLGLCGQEETMEIVGGAMLQIVPSEWYEGFPMVVLEAYASGTPVVASRIGSLGEIISDGETGLLFEAQNPTDLAKKVNMLYYDKRYRLQLGRRARAVFDEKYTAKRNFNLLMDIYQRARNDFEREKYITSKHFS